MFVEFRSFQGIKAYFELILLELLQKWYGKGLAMFREIYRKGICSGEGEDRWRCSKGGDVQGRPGGDVHGRVAGCCAVRPVEMFKREGGGLLPGKEWWRREILS